MLDFLRLPDAADDLILHCLAEGLPGDVANVDRWLAGLGEDALADAVLLVAAGAVVDRVLLLTGPQWRAEVEAVCDVFVAGRAPSLRAALRGMRVLGTRAHDDQVFAELAGSAVNVQALALV